MPLPIKDVKQMKVIIDRFEEDYAVVELEEGDVLTIKIDEEATERRRNRVEERMKLSL